MPTPIAPSYFEGDWMTAWIWRASSRLGVSIASRRTLMTLSKRSFLTLSTALGAGGLGGRLSDWFDGWFGRVLRPSNVTCDVQCDDEDRETVRYQKGRRKGAPDLLGKFPARRKHQSLRSLGVGQINRDDESGSLAATRLRLCDHISRGSASTRERARAGSWKLRWYQNEFLCPSSCYGL